MNFTFLSGVASRLAAVVLGIMLVMTAPSRAQFYEFNFPGASSFDGWDSLNAYTYYGFGSFPGTAPWSNGLWTTAPGSGDARIWKSLNAPNGKGGPFIATSSLYFGNLVQNVNENGGRLYVEDDTPVAGVRTIVLQMLYGEALGHDFHYPDGFPTLVLNNNGIEIPASTTRILKKELVGYTDQSEGGAQPLYNNTWVFVWDLPENLDVSIFAIYFSGVTHSQIYRVQLDQTSTSLPGLFSPIVTLQSHGSPTFNGSVTQMPCTLTAVSPDLVDFSTATPQIHVEYTDNPFHGEWKSAGVYPADASGNIDATISESGDHRSDWSRQLYFRTSHVLPDPEDED